MNVSAVQQEFPEQYGGMPRRAGSSKSLAEADGLANPRRVASAEHVEIDDVKLDSAGPLSFERSSQSLDSVDVGECSSASALQEVGSKAARSSMLLSRGTSSNSLKDDDGLANAKAHLPCDKLNRATSSTSLIDDDGGLDHSCSEALEQRPS